MDFDVPVDHKVKIKERENIGKYLDRAREQKIVEHAVENDISCTWFA